jgi:hypothetical protein
VRKAAPGVVVVRPRATLIVAWIGAVVVVGLFVVIATVLRTADTGVYFRLADQVSMVVLGLFFAAGFLLLARPRVRADGRGIEVRNIVQTRTYTWDQVLRIAFPDSASWARLDLPDDEYLPVLAVQAVDRHRAVEAITALRALHAAARSPHPATSPDSGRTASDRDDVAGRGRGRGTT